MIKASCYLETVPSSLRPNFLGFTVLTFAIGFKYIAQPTAANSYL